MKCVPRNCLISHAVFESLNMRLLPTCTEWKEHMKQNATLNVNIRLLIQLELRDIFMLLFLVITLFGLKMVPKIRYAVSNGNNIPSSTSKRCLGCDTLLFKLSGKKITRFTHISAVMNRLSVCIDSSFAVIKSKLSVLLWEKFYWTEYFSIAFNLNNLSTNLKLIIYRFLFMRILFGFFQFDDTFAEAARYLGKSIWWAAVGSD